jgi:hypothetical protein
MLSFFQLLFLYYLDLQFGYYPHHTLEFEILSE